MPARRPPEAQLIYERRLALGLSFRRAADRAGISEGSWRRTEGPGDKNRTAQTVARMAYAVGLVPAEMTGAGRADAAEQMEALAVVPPSDPVAELRALAARAAELADEIERGNGGPRLRPVPG